MQSPQRAIKALLGCGFTRMEVKDLGMKRMFFRPKNRPASSESLIAVADLW